MKRSFAIILAVVFAIVITSVTAFASSSNTLELKEYTLSYKALIEIENGASLDELVLIKEDHSLVTPSNDENGIKSEPIEYAVRSLESNKVRITDMVSLYFPEYYGRFVLITTSSKPYVIPFSSFPDFFGLTNGRLYTVSNANEIISRTLSHNGEISREMIDEWYFRPFGDIPCRRFKSFYNREELLKVIQDIKPKFAPYLYDTTLTQYKEYSVSHLHFDKLIAINKETGVSISQILSKDKYSWVFPTSRGSYTKAVLEDGKWKELRIAASYAYSDCGGIADGVVRADLIDAAIEKIKDNESCEIEDMDIICT